MTRSAGTLARSRRARRANEPSWSASRSGSATSSRTRFLSRLQDGGAFAEYRDERRAEGAAENTICLELALISHLFATARAEWGMPNLVNPISNVTLPKGSNERNRRLEAGEEEKLLGAHRSACSARPLRRP